MHIIMENQIKQVKIIKSEKQFATYEISIHILLSRIRSYIYIMDY